MARKGRLDRGLLCKKDSTGKPLWYVRLYHEGRERRFGSFKTKTQARDFYEKAKQEQKVGRFFPERYQTGKDEGIDEIIDRYLAILPSSGKKPRTIRDEKMYGEWWKARLKGKRLHHITPSVLDDAKHALATHEYGKKTKDSPPKRYSAQTIVHYMKFLRHVLNVAIRDGKLERNPFTRVKLPRVSIGNTRFLSLEEETKLLKKLGPTYGPWARLAILTGLRKTELFSLPWSQVDFDLGLITLPQTKSGDVQYAPLNEEAKAILRGFESWQFSKWVFPSKNPTTHLDSYNFYGRVFMPAVKDAGLEEVTWHTLRHTFASRLAMNSQTESTIAALLRHKTTGLVKRYAHLSPSHLRAAVEGVASFGKENTEPDQQVAKESQKDTISSPTVTKTGNEERETVGGSA
jgi:integrase